MGDVVARMGWPGGQDGDGTWPHRPALQAKQFSRTLWPLKLCTACLSRGSAWLGPAAAAGQSPEPAHWPWPAGTRGIVRRLQYVYMCCFPMLTGHNHLACPSFLAVLRGMAGMVRRAHAGRKPGRGPAPANRPALVPMLNPTARPASLLPLQCTWVGLICGFAFMQWSFHYVRWYWPAPA